MFIQYYYPSTGKTQDIEVLNPDNKELFITPFVSAIFRVKTFKHKKGVVDYGDPLTMIGYSIDAALKALES